MNLKIKSNNYWKQGIFFIGVFISLIAISISYILIIKFNLNYNKKKYISFISEAQLRLIENKLKTSSHSLYILSDFKDIFSQEINKDKKINLLNDVLADTEFYDIGFINLNGDMVTAKNNNYDVNNKKFFREIISGEEYYFEYEFDEQINEYIFYIAIPTYQDKKLTGVLFC